MKDCTVILHSEYGDVIVDAADAPRVQLYSWRIRFRKGWLSVEATIKQKKETLHRVVLNLQPNDGNIVDHINGNTLDNRRSNLRLVTHQINMVNRKLQRNNKSGYRGVRAKRGKWISEIKVNGVQIHLGCFASAVEAAQAYDAAAKSLRGQIARLNFPHEGAV